MLDVRRNGNGEPTVARIAIKRAGEEGVGLIVDLDLVEEVLLESEAVELDVVVPGALRLWRASKLAQESGAVETSLGGAAAGQADASAGPFGQSKVKPPTEVVRLTMGSGTRLVEIDVEPQTVSVKATPRTCIYTVRVRSTGVLPSDITLLLDWLQGPPVRSTVELRQQSLPFQKPRKVVGEIGDVVAGMHEGVEFAGVITGRSSDSLGETFEINDCGDVLIVGAASVSGTIKLGSNDVSAFTKACKKAKIKPSWTYLIAALGKVYLSSGDSAPWTITDEIVTDAVEIGKVVPAVA